MWRTATTLEPGNSYFGSRWRAKHAPCLHLDVVKRFACGLGQILNWSLPPPVPFCNSLAKKLRHIIAHFNCRFDHGSSETAVYICRSTALAPGSGGGCEPPESVAACTAMLALAKALQICSHSLLKLCCWLDSCCSSITRCSVSFLSFSVSLSAIFCSSKEI